MRLTAATDLGVRMLIYLAAKPGRPVSLEELGEHYRVPPVSFKRSLKPLMDAGIIKSVMGRGGGYVLDGDPRGLWLGEIVRLLERNLDLLPWMAPDETGVTPHPNALYRFAMEFAKKAMLAELDKINLAQLAGDRDTLACLASWGRRFEPSFKDSARDETDDQPSNAEVQVVARQSFCFLRRQALCASG